MEVKVLAHRQPAALHAVLRASVRTGALQAGVGPQDRTHIQEFFTRPSLAAQRGVIIGAMREGYGL